MNRPKLLLAACVLAAVSLAGNAWLLWQRKQTPPPAPASVPDKPAPVLPSTADFDFSGTGLDDNSWKLSDEPPPRVPLDESTIRLSEPAGPGDKGLSTLPPP